MLQALIFDIGNVLLEFDFRHAYEKLEGLCDGYTPDALKTVELLKEACESGRIDRGAFESGVIKALQFRGKPADFSLIWQEIFTINQPMVDFAESMHGKLPLYLLSNTSAIHVEHFLEKYPVFRLFDDAVYSHDVKLAKPDPAIYRAAAKQFGVVPERTGFIDDLLPNIESARSVGFRAVHYDFRRHDLFLAEMQRLLA